MTRFTSTLRKVGKSIVNEVTNLVDNGAAVALVKEQHELVRYFAKRMTSSDRALKKTGVIVMCSAIGIGAGMILASYVN